MKTFVVAHSNAFDNDLTIRKVEANSIEDAMVKTLIFHGWEWVEADTCTEEEIKKICFDCDTLITALEL